MTYIRPNPGGSFHPVLDGYPECKQCLSKSQWCQTTDKTKIQLCWLGFLSFWDEEELELDYQFYSDMKNKPRHLEWERQEIDKLYKKTVLANADKLKENPMFGYPMPPTFD